MEAMIVWEPGVRAAGAVDGCMQARGRVDRAGAAPRVIGDEHLILVAGSAQARMWHQRQVATLPPGTLTAVQGGDVVSVEMPRGCAFCAIQVQPSLLTALAADMAELRPFVDGTAGQARLACCLAGEAALGQARDAAGSEAALRRFLAYALPACKERMRPAESSDHAVVLRIRDYLRREFARTVTLDELGRRAGMCRFALVRAFTREVGLPPHAYQTHLRVLHACVLIRRGTPLSVVALNVGFSDQSHLCRHFKRILGMTPGAYAREVARVGQPTTCKPALMAAA
ncbi:MAG TPA: AraC family transcriptional regulator [Longimicrobium sp.]|nr:AraC family transcriptional regulator [Longimicrobium sp.]